MSYVNKFLSFILLLGIFGSVTNIYYFSAIPSLVAAGLSVLYIIKFRTKLENYQGWLIVLFLYIILSTLLYFPQSFLAFGFYRYDANFFISYLPLLLFPFFVFKFENDKIVKLFFFFESILSLTFYFLYQYNGSNAYNLSDNQMFTGLFFAANAAGGFYSVICCVALVYWWHNRKNLDYIFFAFVNIFCLFSTFSRGSIIGLFIGGILFILIIYKKYLISFLLFIGLFMGQLYLISDTYKLYSEEIRCLNDPIIGMDYYLKNKHGVGLQKVKQRNVQIRLYENWPRGIYCFLHSPVFGTGMGSANDTPFQLKEKSYFQFNTSVNKSFSSGHAHHSILHIAAELGLVGIFIFSSFLFYFIKKLIYYGNGNLLALSVLFSLCNIIVASLTEHRLTTPASVLPMVLFFCLLSANTDKHEIKNLS